jgi:hypothetical protein
MSTTEASPPMHQAAPFPHELVGLVSALRYREHLGWRVTLVPDLVRDPATTHAGESRGLTLVVTRCGPDTYHPVNIELRARELLDAIDKDQPVAELASQLRAAVDALLPVNHYFAVPPATYNRQSWMRWLFDRLGDVDDHERMEDFAFAHEEQDSISGLLKMPPHTVTERPYAPNHGPGWNPYLVTVLGTEEDRRTSFTGKVNPG